MLILAVLIILTLISGIFFKNAFSVKLRRMKRQYEEARAEYGRLSQENNELVANNTGLKNELESMIALYDITKEICKSLDEAKVFELFKAQISRYIRVKDCRLLAKDADLSAYKDWIVLPLEIERVNAGYLAAEGIEENQRDKFNILAQQFILGIKRAILYHRVQELAITDTLTGVLSRRHWMERFNQELERSKKFKYRFSFLMIDIDHFKTFNDRYGHLVGDAILRGVSERIKENIRQVDLIGRYGGEEFSVILTETDKEGAMLAAERIRRAVEEKYITIYDESLKISVSIGIAVFPDHAGRAEGLVEKADQALYHAKQTGRNKVCVCSESS
ncbi:MAG: GGDEF domain-containing protein [Candidatus Omnitrophota bacterium]